MRYGDRHVGVETLAALEEPPERAGPLRPVRERMLIFHGQPPVDDADDEWPLTDRGDLQPGRTVRAHHVEAAGNQAYVEPLHRLVKAQPLRTVDGPPAHGRLLERSARLSLVIQLQPNSLTRSYRDVSYHKRDTSRYPTSSNLRPTEAHRCPGIRVPTCTTATVATA